MVNESILRFENLIDIGDGFDELSKEIEKLERDLVQAAKNIQKAFSNVKPDDIEGVQKFETATKELMQSQKMLIKQQSALQKAKKKTIDLTDEELIQREKEKLAARERVKIAKQQAILLNKESGEIEKLRAKLALTTIQWKKLSKAELDNTKTGKALVVTKKRLTDQLKKLEKQTGDTRRNVGNYSDSLGKLGKVAARVFIGRTIVDGLRSISNRVLNLIEKNKDASKSIADLDDAFQNAGSAFNRLGSSLLNIFAPALTVIANGLAATADFLSGNVQGAKEFQATSEELTKTIDGLNSEFAKESAELAIVFNELNNTTEGTEERTEAIDKVNAAYGQYLPNLLTEESTLKDIAQAQKLANEALTKTFLLKTQQATLDNILTNSAKSQIEAFSELEKTFQANGISIKSNVAQLNQLVNGLSDTEGEGFAATRALTGLSITFDRYNDIVRKTNPTLADFLQEIRNIEGPSRDVLITQIKAAERTNDSFNAAISKTNQTINDISKSIQLYDHSVTTNTGNLNANTKAQEENTQARLDAINALSKQVADAEANNIEDKQEMLLRLEELRFEAENQLRIEKFNELKVLLANQAEELAQAESLNQRLSEAQLEAHEQKKLDIRKKFAIETTEIQPIDVLDDSNAEVEALLNEEVELVEDANERIKTSNKELLDDISKTAKKVGELISDTFEKQADLSKARVDEQEQNLAAARDRAANGLEANLAFEKQELAKRQLEQQQRQKEAEQAARLVTLFNLVAAYAQSGDTNALSRGLVDFALLTALSAGFEEGGFTGSDSSNSTVKGLVHANEYVVTAKDTARFGLTGKSGDEFGEAMGDYFNPHSPTLQNLYNRQRDSFATATATKVVVDTNKAVVSEIQELRKDMKSQPNFSAELVKFKREVYGMVIKEMKNQVTKITRQRIKT